MTGLVTSGLSRNPSTWNAAPQLTAKAATPKGYRRRHGSAKQPTAASRTAGHLRSKRCSRGMMEAATTDSTNSPNATATSKDLLRRP
ncbi:hypothetical protein [Streptomyces sp. LN325]|uniref:hypothetical protein n=1 Tax=Streptomyces sp. LN325 TaxID=3112976 RepID=UPI00363F924F